MTIDTLRGTIYTSATLTVTGSSDVLDIGGNFKTGFFAIVGSGITTDETLDLTVDFYADSSGTTSLGTITFGQLLDGTLTRVQIWPGGVTARDHPLHIPRFIKLTWTIAGSTPLMTFVLSGDLRG